MFWLAVHKIGLFVLGISPWLIFVAYLRKRDRQQEQEKLSKNNKE